jgi:hypothetical protein
VQLLKTSTSLTVLVREVARTEELIASRSDHQRLPSKSKLYADANNLPQPTIKIYVCLLSHAAASWRSGQQSLVSHP